MLQTLDIKRSRFARLPNEHTVVLPLSQLRVVCPSFHPTLALDQDFDENVAPAAGEECVRLRKTAGGWQALEVFNRPTVIPGCGVDAHRCVPVTSFQPFFVEELPKKSLPPAFDVLQALFSSHIVQIMSNYLWSYRVPVKSLFISFTTGKTYADQTTQLELGGFNNKQWATMFCFPGDSTYHVEVERGTSIAEHFGAPKYGYVSCVLHIIDATNLSKSTRAKRKIKRKKSKNKSKTKKKKQGCSTPATRNGINAFPCKSLV
jgi:hypothetical protein